MRDCQAEVLANHDEVLARPGFKRYLYSEILLLLQDSDRVYLIYNVLYIPVCMYVCMYVCSISVHCDKWS